MIFSSGPQASSWSRTSYWLLAGLLAGTTSSSATADAGVAPTRPVVNTAPSDSLRLRITVNGRVFTARLVAGETTRAFVELLPLTLRLSDLGGREKYSGLPGRLPAPEYAVHNTYQPGNLSYWRGGGLAVFYHQDGHQVQVGLVVLAQLDSAATAQFAAPGPVKATFEVVAR